MSDLIERLREKCGTITFGTKTYRVFPPAHDPLRSEAADELSRLQAEVEKSDAAFQQISVAIGGTDEWADRATMIAYVVAEVESLRAERDTFYMDYRTKADEETKQLTGELAAMRAELLRAQKWIVNNPSRLPDHACQRCVPHSDMLVPDFVCVYHAAIDAAIAAKVE